MDIRAFKTHFDPYLKEALVAYERDIKAGIKDLFIRDIATYSNKLLLAGGKRVRPYIAYLMYTATGGNKKKSFLKLIVGLEIYHMFCLVHDDIIDRSATRHGIMTAHKYATAQIKKGARAGDHGHVANGQAMLLGDLQFGLAHDLVCNSTDFNEKAMRSVRKYYADMVRQIILGEMLDVDMAVRERVPEKTIMQKMEKKTAQYTFVHPLLIGLALSGGSKKYEDFCREFGMALGIAYQIQDDLMDLTFSSEATQKPAFGDIEAHVHTLFTGYIFEHGSPKEKKELSNLMGSTISPEDYQKVRDLFERSGSLEYGNKVMRRYFKKARNKLAGAGLKKADQASFEALIDFIEHRKH